MRFKPEKEDIPQKDCNNRITRRVPTQIRLNNKTTFSLPSVSYIIQDEATGQRFEIFDLKYDISNPSYGLTESIKLRNRGLFRLHGIRN